MKKGNRWAALLLALACAGSLAACQEKQEDVPEEQYDAKPVVYLYPEEETQVTVQLDYAGELTCTYPAYNDGWTVIASPDGTLTDGEGQTYSYLYWEGKDNVEYDFSQGRRPDYSTKSIALFSKKHNIISCHSGFLWILCVQFPAVEGAALAVVDSGGEVQGGLV